MKSFRNIAIVVVIIFLVTVCCIPFMDSLMLLTFVKPVDTSWVVRDPSYRESSDFQYGRFSLGQPERGCNLDKKEIAAKYSDIELPQTIRFCEVDHKGEITLLVGWSEVEESDQEYYCKSDVFVRKQNNLVKVYEAHDIITVYSISPDGTKMALVLSDDVVVLDIDNLTASSCGISSVDEVVKPCWQSENEILISTMDEKIVLYDVSSGKSDVVLGGSSPVRWKGGLIFQRFDGQLGKGMCRIYFLEKIGGKESLLFEAPYICGPLSLSPDGSYLCAQASYTYTEKGYQVLFPGISLYVRNMNDGIFTFFTDEEYYDRYWIWIDQEDSDEERN